MQNITKHILLDLENNRNITKIELNDKLFSVSFWLISFHYLEIMYINRMLRHTQQLDTKLNGFYLSS